MTMSIHFAADRPKVLDDEPWIVFLDESGDQGKPSIESLMDQDRQPEEEWKPHPGGTRYFTIGALAIKSSMVERVEMEYQRWLREKKNERKWSTCSMHTKKSFIGASASILQIYKDQCRFGGITIDKAKLSDHAIKEHKVSIYNAMAQQLVCRLTEIHKKDRIEFPRDIRLVCDQRPVPDTAFTDLVACVSNALAVPTNFQSTVTCESVDSKNIFMIQMADCLSGLIRQKIERNIRIDGWRNLSRHLVHKMFHEPSLPMHHKYKEWSGDPLFPHP
jgi:hypothetical protein